MLSGRTPCIPYWDARLDDLVEWTGANAVVED